MRTRFLTWILLGFSFLANAQVMEGNYKLNLSFTRPASMNYSYDCRTCSFSIQNGIPSVALDYRISDPATASTNHGILKANGTGSFIGENLRIEGTAAFETFENDKSDMAVEAALVMDGKAVSDNGSYGFSGSFKMLKDGESIFEGTFEASMEKGGQMVRLIRGTAEISRSTGGPVQPLLEGQEVAIRLNDQLKTSENTLVEILVAGESIMKVKSNSVLSIIKPGFSLQQGEAWFILQTPVQLITPYANCGTTNSEFIIRVDKESSVVNLLEGQLTVSDKIGNKVNLEPGQAIKATTLGLGAVVGFDENQVKSAFEDKKNSLSNLNIQVNTLLIVGAVLVIVIILLIFRFTRKKRKHRIEEPSLQATPSPVVRNTIRSGPVPPPDIATPKAGTASTFCENCGTKLVSGAKFCTVCGTRVL